MTGRVGNAVPLSPQGLSGAVSVPSSHAACRVTHIQRHGQYE